MDPLVRARLDWVEEVAAEDACYRELLLKNKLLEKRFGQAVRRLSDEDRATVWDYVMNCEDMSRRMLELACTK